MLTPWLQAQAGGLLLGLAFAIDGAGWLAWPALWLVAVGLDGRSAWERAGDGSLAGVWAAGIAVGPWLFDATRAQLGGDTVTATIVTVGAIVLHGGGALAAFALLWPRLPAPRWLTGPATWTAIELARGGAIWGVPWALLGHSQYGWPALVQIAELGGVPLVSFVVAMPGLALADRPASRRVGLAVAAGVVVAAAAFGTVRLVQWAKPLERGVLVRGVSGGHLSADRIVAYPMATLDGPSAQVLVWPAHVVEIFVEMDMQNFVPVIEVARRHGPLLLGVGRRERDVPGARRFESSLLLGSEASTHGRYDKRRLVPFLERAPWGLPGLAPEAPITAGEGRGIPLRVADLRIGPLLGWESIFPELSRWWAQAGVDLLVSQATDESLGDGARQLVLFSSFRAIETRRWMLRVSGTGRTHVIDPAGRRWRKPIVEIIPGRGRPVTLYMRAPWLLPAALAALLGAVLVASVVDSRTRRP